MVNLARLANWFVKKSGQRKLYNKGSIYQLVSFAYNLSLKDTKQTNGITYNDIGLLPAYRHSFE